MCSHSICCFSCMFCRCFQVFELLCSSGHAVSFCDNGGFRLISRAIAAYRGGATLLRHNALSCAVASASLKPIVHLHWPNSDIVALLVELSMLVHFFTFNLQISTRTARSNSLIRQDQTWPVSYCEEASSALFVATETEPLIVKSIVDKKLCASLVSAAAAMSEHSCPVAVALLRVCCKCMQSLSVETSRQLHNSATVQGLTAILKSSTMHRDPQLANTTSIESLRMYSSMLLISLASELGEAVLQVVLGVYVFSLLASHLLQPLLAHGSIKHICAAISQSSFISWALSDRIGSSYALLALCRERRTWLLLAEAFVERAILQLMLDSCHEVIIVFWCFFAAHFACSGAHERNAYGHCRRSAWSQPNAAHGQACSQQLVPNILQLHVWSGGSVTGPRARKRRV